MAATKTKYHTKKGSTKESQSASVSGWHGAIVLDRHTTLHTNNTQYILKQWLIQVYCTCHCVVICTIAFLNILVASSTCSSFTTSLHWGGSQLWARRFCKSESSNLCNSLAAVARWLCTTDVHLTAFAACRLIPQNKNPGIRPIGIGEVPRRIIAKAIPKTIRDDIQSAAGPLQACAGHEVGCSTSNERDTHPG